MQKSGDVIQPGATMRSPRMRVHHVLGANTDVGKTVFATALAIASAALPIGRTTAPSLAPHADADKVTYLKPVSTGPDSDADSSYVAADRHIARFAPHIPSRTLVQFREPLSPHVAARRPDGSLPPHASDAAIVHGVASWIQTESARASVAYIESAGGVHSPAPSGSSQADLLRPLRLPVVLVGSSELGGISTTRAAFESLRMRGYDVEAVLMFPSHIYENDIYLRQWLAEEHGVPVFTLGGSNGGTVPGAPPPRAATDAGDAAAMHAYYDALIRGNEEQQLSSVFQVVAHLRESHTKRYSDLASLAGRARNSFWWPFTQHERVTRDSDVLVIDSAYADHFEALNSSGALAPVLDGSSSWWTQALGHGSPRIAQAAAYAAGRYGHVIFPGAAHAPAVELAETMLNGHIAPGRGWASRVFFSDDGSTATEIALKMAIQSAARRYAPERAESDLAQAKLSRRGPGGISGRPEREFEVLGLDGSYHGDTIGAMDACSPNVFNKEVAWYRGRGCWLSAPTVSIRDGVAQVAADEVHTFDSLAEVLDVDRRLQTDLALHYRMSIRRTLEHLVVVERRRFGALVLEPVVMGAGGMIFVDPLYQHCLVDVVRESEDLFALTDAPLRSARAPVPPSSETTWRGLPVVYDECVYCLPGCFLASFDLEVRLPLR